MLQFGVSHQGWLPGPLPLNVDILSPVSPHLLAPAAPMFLNKQKIEQQDCAMTIVILQHDMYMYSKHKKHRRHVGLFPFMDMSSP